jgi:peroxiredoxin Q/BCP
MLEKGTSAPSFSVKDHNGDDISLADFKGKKVVLWFYPKADTPGCTVEGKGFRDDYQKSFSFNGTAWGICLRIKP